MLCEEDYKLKKAVENRYLYVVKCIACLFVILIHAKFPGLFGDGAEAIARFGVPMFFAISGRYLLKADDRSAADIRKRVIPKLKRLCIITLVMTLIYTAYSFLYAYFIGFSVSELFFYKYNPYELTTMLVFNSGQMIHDYTYTFDHLWFLFALIYVYVLIIIFARFLYKWKRGLIIILLGFLFFGELLQTYYPIRPFNINICTWYVLRNWLFVGIPFTLIGIESNDDIYHRTSSGVVGNICIILGVISTFAEFIMWGTKEVYFGSFLIVIGCLLAANHYEPPRKYATSKFGSILVFIGKELSGNIYYFHVMVISLVDHFIYVLNNNIVFLWFKPVIFTLITILLALVIYGIVYLFSNIVKVQNR
jgi:surface polysaccharide O-acyltransferase-like enzyme